MMEENQLGGQGYIHHQYGHQQDEYQQHHQHQPQFDPQASYDNYSSQQHHHLQHSQYSPEYSGENQSVMSVTNLNRQFLRRLLSHNFQLLQS